MVFEVPLTFSLVFSPATQITRTIPCECVKRLERSVWALECISSNEKSLPYFLLEQEEKKK